MRSCFYFLTFIYPEIGRISDHAAPKQESLCLSVLAGRKNALPCDVSSQQEAADVLQQVRRTQMQREEADRVMRHSRHAGETARQPVIPKETIILARIDSTMQDSAPPVGPPMSKVVLL